jgi:alpha-galactosidase
MNTHQPPLFMPNYADIVRPEERDAMRTWLEQTLAAVRTTAVPPPQAAVRCIRQRGFDGVCYRGLARNGQPLRLKGTVYPAGIGMATGTALRVDLPSPGRRFTCRVGVQDGNAPATGTPARFQVESEDGRPLWSSRSLSAGDEPAAVDLALAGRRAIVLKADGPGLHANWVDARVELENGTVCILGEPRRQDACFDFTVDGKPCGELLHGWALAEETWPAERGIARRRITRTDPATGLELILELAVDEAFPAVEWTLRFRNTGAVDSPLIADVRSLEFIQPADLGYIYIDTTRGDPARWESYSPCRYAIGSQFFGQHEPTFDEYRFAPVGGHSTDGAWPYFRIEFSSTGGGVFAAVGWPGQWQAHASRDAETFRLTAGQELTRFRLRPGEEVCAPLSALLFWRGGDTMRAQNLWRRWMLARNLPRTDDQLPAPMLNATSAGFTYEMVGTDAAMQTRLLDLHETRRLPIDHWWMDAGWYRVEGGLDWPRTGTWEVDRERFPDGIRAISDHAHAQGIKTILWFEPERVAAGSWLAENKPEWILRLKAWEWQALDLGNPRARAWLVERINSLIESEGVDVYRQDFNFPPLDFWREHDAPERQGITEMQYVEGLLAFWDELRRRHPRLLIDECASGGRRNDLECMRRAVPLHRTDFNYADQAARQSMTHGLSAWLPFSGTNVLPLNKVDAYVFRSALAPSTTITFDVRRDDLDYDLLRRLMDERQRLTPYLYGDYYPLTPGGPSEADWIAWQFHRPDLGAGMVQVFRRADSPFETGRFRLHGLEPEAVYQITDLDRPDEHTTMTGRELMETGAAITMREQPQAVIMTYNTRSIL